MRNRIKPGTGFRFFNWDAEHMNEDQNANILNENNDKCPSRLFQQMRQNKQFRILFADRVQKFCFDNGALTPARAAERWMFRANQLNNAILAESARWGDYRRDVHPWQGTGPYLLYTRETWFTQQNFLINTYFPQRTGIFISQLKAAGLFPSVNSPVLRINGQQYSKNQIMKNDVLTMSADAGVIYYTTDGKDPLLWESSTMYPGAKLYSSALTLSGSIHIKARVLSGNEWSALKEEYFIYPEDYHNLRITEINYHPLDEKNIENKEFEFIEIKNTGPSALDMGGVKVSCGADFTFPAETHLGPGSLVVLASNSAEFYNRYKFFPFGEFTGNLDNTGETIVLTGPYNDTLCIVPYEDWNGWSEAADGLGKTLVPVFTNPLADQQSPLTWRESYRTGGSPGADDLFVLQTGTEKEFATLYQNYPNPFAGSTTIGYELRENAHVELVVIDISGRLVVTLESTEKESGTYEVKWDGANNGANTGKGMYFYKLIVRNSKGDTYALVRKMIIVK
jgi:hypothetical protein